MRVINNNLSRLGMTGRDKSPGRQQGQVKVAWSMALLNIRACRASTPGRSSPLLTSAKADQNYTNKYSCIEADFGNSWRYRQVLQQGFVEACFDGVL